MKRSLAIKDDTSGSVLLSDLLLFRRSMNRMLSELQDRVYFINKVNGNSISLLNMSFVLHNHAFGGCEGLCFLLIFSYEYIF